MEGLKQCPECQCMDVPANAEICPFCGHPFEKKPDVKPVKKKAKKPREAEGPMNLSDDSPFSQLGYGNTLDEQPMKTEPVTVADQVQNQGSTVPVSGDSALPNSTEYKTYKKKGIMGRTSSDASGQGQKVKVFLSALLTMLAVAALCMVYVCTSIAEIYIGGWNIAIWINILHGALIASMHCCCFDDVKGSRKAGLLGVIVGHGYFIIFLYLRYGNLAYAIGRFIAPMLILIITYAVCWFTTAKLVENRKSTKTLLLTAVEMRLISFVLNRLWAWWRWRQNYGDGQPFNWIQMINWWLLALDVAAMLLTVFLLFRVKKWLAAKPRKLFWVLYAVIIIGVMLYIHNGIKVGRIRIYY